MAIITRNAPPRKKCREDRDAKKQLTQDNDTDESIRSADVDRTLERLKNMHAKKKKRTIPDADNNNQNNNNVYNEEEESSISSQGGPVEFEYRAGIGGKELLVKKSSKSVKKPATVSVNVEASCKVNIPVVWKRI